MGWFYEGTPMNQWFMAVLAVPSMVPGKFMGIL
jgi:hypothetical protein